MGLYEGGAGVRGGAGAGGRFGGGGGGGFGTCSSDPSGRRFGITAGVEFFVNCFVGLTGGGGQGGGGGGGFVCPCDLGALSGASNARGAFTGASLTTWFGGPVIALNVGRSFTDISMGIG